MFPGSTFTWFLPNFWACFSSLAINTVNSLILSYSISSSIACTEKSYWCNPVLRNQVQAANIFHLDYCNSLGALYSLFCLPEILCCNIFTWVASLPLQDSTQTHLFKSYQGEVLSLPYAKWPPTLTLLICPLLFSFILFSTTLVSTQNTYYNLLAPVVCKLRENSNTLLVAYISWNLVQCLVYIRYSTNIYFMNIWMHLNYVQM